MWLLDPSDLTISNAATTDVADSGAPIDTFTADNNTNTSNLNVTDLTNALLSSSVTVQTTANGSGTGAGNITVADDITWATGNTLILNALNDIFINAAISSTNSGLILNAGSSSNSTTISSSGSIDTTTLTLGTGSLILGAANRIGDLTAVTISANTTFNLNNFNETIGSLASGGSGVGALQLGSATLTTGGNNSSTTYGGSISGTGGITKEGSGSWQLSPLVANTYSGATTINAGVLAMRADSAVSATSDVIVGLGATFNVAGTTQTIGSLSGSGSVILGSMSGLGTLTDGHLITGNNNNSTTFSGSISEFAGTTSTLTKVGTGNFTLSGANSYSGLTTVSAGILSANHADALGTTATGTTVASGATLNIDSVAIAGENITLNGGTLNSLGAAQLTGNIDLGGSSTISANSGSTFTLDGTINGAQALALQGLGTINLNNTVGDTTPLTGLTASVSGLNINGGLIETSGNQIYNTLVTLGAMTTFASSGAGSISIAMNNGIAGNQNVIFSGGAGTNDTFSITGPLSVNNVTVDGNGGINSLGVNTGGTQQWNLIGTNAGNLVGLTGVAGNFTYNNIANITGGSGNDDFIITDNAIITGVVDGSGGTNTLDYSNYIAPVTVVLASTFAGDVIDPLSATIATYNNINSLVGDYVNDNINTQNKNFSITFTNTREGYIDDPIFFFGFTVDGVAFASSTPTSSEPNVAGIIQQPVVNGDDAANSPSSSTPQWVITSDITNENLEDILNQFTEEYNATLDKVKINPFCYAAS